MVGINVPRQLALLVVEGKRLGWNASVSCRTLALQPEHVLLHLGVAKGLAHSTTISAEEVIRHVGVEVEILFLGYKVSCSGSHFELLVIPVEYLMVSHSEIKT